MILNNNINSVEDLENNIIEYVKYSINNMVGGGKTTEGRGTLRRTIKKGLSDYLNENKKQIKHKKIKLNRDRMEQKISEIFDNKFNNNNYNNLNSNSQMQLFDMFNFHVPLAPVHSKTAISQLIEPKLPELTYDTPELVNIITTYIKDTQEYIKKTLGNNPIILSKLIEEYYNFMMKLEELKKLIAQNNLTNIISIANEMKDKFEEFIKIMHEHIQKIKSESQLEFPLFDIKALSEMDPMTLERVQEFALSYSDKIQNYKSYLLSLLNDIPKSILTINNTLMLEINTLLDVIRPPVYRENKVKKFYKGLFEKGKEEQMIRISIDMSKTFLYFVKEIIKAIDMQANEYMKKENIAIKNKLRDMSLTEFSNVSWNKLKNELIKNTKTPPSDWEGIKEFIKLLHPSGSGPDPNYSVPSVPEDVDYETRGRGKGATSGYETPVVSATSVYETPVVIATSGYETPAEPAEPIYAAPPSLLTRSVNAVKTLLGVLKPTALN